MVNDYIKETENIMQEWNESKINKKIYNIKYQSIQLKYQEKLTKLLLKDNLSI